MMKIDTKKIKRNLFPTSVVSLLLLSLPCSDLEADKEGQNTSTPLYNLNPFLINENEPIILNGEALVKEEKNPELQRQCHSISFNNVPVVEFIKFVSKISNINFIFDHKDLQFNISLSSGNRVSSEHVVSALIQMLRNHGFGVVSQDNYYVIHKYTGKQIEDGQAFSEREMILHGLTAAKDVKDTPEPYEFSVYKLQYHQGSEIQEAIKKIAIDFKSHPEPPQKLLRAIDSLQWVKTTNSLLFSGEEEALVSLKKLIRTLDVPLRQVFIEVLVVETDLRKSTEFGLQWATGGKLFNKVGFGMGNFNHAGGAGSFADTMQGINASNTPTGLNQIPIGSAFDVGVIGDIIMHRGRSYLSLGSLVSALQRDGESTIVLNQKIITQDNKNSKIFVGDNIPFTGSVVQTVGQSQQTTANIEYRDIGVSLSITPMLGEGEVITLDIDEEITESLQNLDAAPSNTVVNGIRTTKTNMVTHVHVPDKHFLVLSGMIRNAKASHKSGLPCLGSIPGIGAAFSKNKRQDEKRNVIIFVRPHIIHSVEDYKKVTQTQEDLYQQQSAPGSFREAVELLPPVQ